MHGFWSNTHMAKFRFLYLIAVAVILSWVIFKRQKFRNLYIPRRNEVEKIDTKEWKYKSTLVESSRFQESHKHFSQTSMTLLNSIPLYSTSFSKIPCKSCNEKSAKRITIVVAASQDHGQELVNEYLPNFRRYMIGHNLIVFDLGLKYDIKDKLLMQLKKVGGEYRKFPFRRYPGTKVRLLQQYRFKPLVMAEVLAEYDMVLWTDTSVVFQTSNWKNVCWMLSCQAYCGKLEDSVNCTNMPVWIGYKAHHSIYSATDPIMYDYLLGHLTISTLIDTRQSASGVVGMYRTHDAVYKILKWWILCALEDDCMSPPKATRHCDFYAGLAGRMGTCHRFDQAALTLIMLNFQPDNRNFTLDDLGIASKLVKIVRKQ